MSPLIIYFICKIMQFDFINKIINHFLGIEIKIFENDENMMEKLEKMNAVFNVYPINEFSKIKKTLLEIYVN